MGLGIGDSLPGLVQQPGGGTGRVAGAPPERDGEEPRRPEVGFGDNTLSPANAALNTIDQTVDRAQDFVPSIEDLAQEFRDRVEIGTAIEDAQNRSEETENQGLLPLPERVRPEPSPQVRNFEEAGAIPSPLNGSEGVPASNGNPSVLANDGNPSAPASNEPGHNTNPANTRLDVFS